MNNNYKFLIILICCITLISCKKELEEANINPNNPEHVDPEYLLNTSVLNTMNLFGGNMRRETLSHYSNYVSVGGGQMQRYYTFASAVNGYWSALYVSCLQPVHQIQLNYAADPGYKNRVAIAKIFESYIFSNMVAIWGSIPKTKALNGDAYTAYDKEEDIYKGLLKDLKEAANAIDLNGDTYVGKADAVFGGDLLKWKKFANTLRLRLAIQIANASPTSAQEVISEVLANESTTITAAGETAKAYWNTTSDTWSYLYDYNVLKAAANASSLNVISEALIQYMLPYNDPRLPIYAKPAPQGPYKGKYWGQPKATQLPAGVSIPGGNPHSPLGQLDYAQIGDYFTKPDAEYVFLSYEESCFLKAEAALKGWGGSKTAEQYYRDGITASMSKYNIPQQGISDYLEQPGIKWNTVVDTIGRAAEFEDYIGITSSAITKPDPYRQLITQTWLAGFYNAMDAWTLIRRSQVLEFAPHFNPDGGEGGTVGYAYIPQRLNYPGIEFQVNTSEINKAIPWLGGADALKTKLWFALPVKKNPFLPQ
ncbi:MAG: SusD/RagB family nutrient-binding outer membrane lipoprotein [Bacteroidota bacterium]